MLNRQTSCHFLLSPNLRLGLGVGPYLRGVGEGQHVLHGNLTGDQQSLAEVGLAPLNQLPDGPMQQKPCAAELGLHCVLPDLHIELHHKGINIREASLPSRRYLDFAFSSGNACTSKSA